MNKETTIIHMRGVRPIAFGVLGFSIVVVLGVHIYAEVYRIRAEHLLATLKTFQVEETPAAAVLKLRREYSSQAVNQGVCSEEHCDFGIALTEWESLMKPSNHEWLERTRDFLMNVLRPFGLRLTVFDTHLQLEKGKLRKLDVRLMHAYVEQDKFPNFIARAFTAGNLSRWLGWQGVYEHPNVLVWEPNACTGCTGAITADFTWQASRVEIERALGFDLSCITRFHVCRTVEEFLPSAAQLLKDDRARLSANMDWKLPCDTRTARILGRDSDLVNLARVKLIGHEEGEYVATDYEPLKVLKGQPTHMDNIYIRKEFREAANGDSGPPQRLLQRGAERIVFLNVELEKPAAWFECALLLNTPENLTATLEGIAADRSDTIGKE
jgi:hypothetical protein